MSMIAMGRVSLESDYVHFRDPVSVDVPEPQVEGVVRLLGEKLAVTMEATIDHTALHGPVVC
jgi:hypothetical protein